MNKNKSFNGATTATSTLPHNLFSRQQSDILNRTFNRQDAMNNDLHVTLIPRTSQFKRRRNLDFRDNQQKFLGLTQQQIYPNTYKLEEDGMLDEMKRLTQEEMKKVAVNQPFIGEAQERIRVKKLELENLRHKAYTGSLVFEKPQSSQTIENLVLPKQPQGRNLMLNGGRNSTQTNQTLLPRSKTAIQNNNQLNQTFITAGSGSIVIIENNDNSTTSGISGMRQATKQEKRRKQSIQKILGHQIDLDSRRSFLDSAMKGGQKSFVEGNSLMKKKQLKFNLTQDIGGRSPKDNKVHHHTTQDSGSGAGDETQSHLSKEVQSVPLYHLRRLFKGKLSEYNQCMVKNRIGDYDSDTIFRADVNENYKRQLEQEHLAKVKEKERIQQEEMARIQRLMNPQEEEQPQLPVFGIFAPPQQQQQVIKKQQQEQPSKQREDSETIFDPTEDKSYQDFLDQSVFIARGKNKPFIQSYQKKYRINLTDVTPFTKDKMNTLFKRQMLEQRLFDAILRGIKSKKSIQYLKEEERKALLEERRASSQNKKAHKKKRKDGSPSPIKFGQSMTDSIIAGTATSTLYKDPHGFFEGNLDSKLKASNENYQGLSGKPIKKNTNFFKRINRKSDALYSNTVNFINNYRTDQESSLLKSIGRVLRDQGTIEEDIRKAQKMQRLNRSREEIAKKVRESSNEREEYTLEDEKHLLMIGRSNDSQDLQNAMQEPDLIVFKRDSLNKNRFSPTCDSSKILKWTQHHPSVDLNSTNEVLMMLGLREMAQGQENDVDANETVISSSSESIEDNSNKNEDDNDDPNQ